MKDRLVGLQQAADVERDWYERHLQQLGNEYKETKDQLISENTLIGENETARKLKLLTHHNSNERVKVATS